MTIDWRQVKQGWLLRYKSERCSEPVWIRLGKIHANDESFSLVAVGEVCRRLVGGVESPASRYGSTSRSAMRIWLRFVQDAHNLHCQIEPEHPARPAADAFHERL